MTYHPAIVANALLQGARQRGIAVDHMKLQKLVFFVHAWSLALNGTSPVAEKPQPWDYGPVFSDLYHQLKSFGRRQIDQYIPTFNPATGMHQPLIPSADDTSTWNMVDQVLNRYGQMTALQLSTLSHEPGGPWEQARASHAPELADPAIAEFYRRKMMVNANA